MSSELPLKRRRLNDSTQVLSRPFVSPLRTPKLDGAASGTDIANPSYRPSVLAHTINATPTRLSNDPAHTPPKFTPTRKQPRSNLHVSSKPTNPSEIAAQRALTALELQIRSVRNDIDTLNQAAQLSSSTTDSNLKELMQKWKVASQAAADELFESAKERVSQMGGVAAWRVTERQKYGMGGFEADEDTDEDCKFDSAGEELSDEERECRKKEKRRLKREMREAADAEEIDGMSEKDKKAKLGISGVAEDGFDATETFTMDMMLRSLNIELDVIGYDKAGERWVC